ncbi:uncharacterized protein LOC128244907 isoform X4 [Mya arenaria]|uniref:uncharacterized protein LOC128244907 isoform X4 n=1 Tax=Mya arenaria TaxID=6604 RepID=UPI0022E61E91|nr:uncharacterized protein LOC128244907 isoform X4 [Mya arenaria]
MSNPYMDRGYTLPYQISQHKYKEQVFGGRPSFYDGQRKPEPLDGRDKRFEQQSYISPRYEQQSYQSPRQEPEQQARAYRSGRPDLGFEPPKDVYVPYPQEPFRRRHNEYEQPPEIGYDPYASEQQQKSSKTRQDLTTEDGHGPHPGWLLLLRFHKDGLSQVQRALTMAQKHIEMDQGRILGIARSYAIRIVEGGDGWVLFGGMRHMGNGQWGVKDSPRHDDTNYCMLAIYYPSLARAIQWFDRDSAFKQKDFPPPHTTDCIALPLNAGVDTKFSKTLVMSEYPKISHPEYFRDKFSIPTEDMLRTRFRSNPYVVKATSMAIDDPRKRVARHLRGCWIKQNGIISVSMFESIQEAQRYYNDPEYLKAKECQDRVSAPNTVIVGLEDWRL